MADTEEPQFTSLADRIAALNKQKDFDTSEGAAAPTPVRKRPPPPPPGAIHDRPTLEARSKTAPAIPVNGSIPRQTPEIPARPSKAAPPPLPRRDTKTSLGEAPKAAPPPLPSRTPSFQPSLGSPQRSVTQPAHLSARRNSGSSEISQHSTRSNLSQTQTISSSTSQGSESTARFKLPPAFDHANMPVLLPPTKRELQAQAQEVKTKDAVKARQYLTTRRSSPSVPQLQSVSRTASAPQVPQVPQVLQVESAPATPAMKPSLPPRLPSRPARSKTPVPPAPQEPAPTQPTPKPVTATARLPLGAGIRGFGDRKQDKIPPMPSRPAAAPQDAPPPIPLASRPSMAQIESVSASVAAASPAPPQAAHDCWICRDWSGPDNIAAQFPKESLPRNDPVGHLAHGLCSPFPSYTDKARAIFTWFHHNIFYDTVAFFGNNVRHQTVEQTIFSGLAVCQGYAETYAAIAKRAGLDCVVVGGHGKGFGHNALKKGERPPPPKPDGHAWNAVRIDGGVWKLLDACWGAGHLCGANNLYKQEFTPEEFIKPNDKFGRTHFPRDPKHQFRDDGRTISWDEYFIGRVNGDTPVIYGNAKQEGIAEDSVEPKELQVPVYSGETVRFQFSKICEHWTSERDGLGAPPLLLLSIHGVDGRKDEMVPIETDGYWHWADVDARKLGAPGQSVQVANLTSINGQDARGASAEEFLSKKGRVGMGWSYVMKWDLV